MATRGAVADERAAVTQYRPLCGQCLASCDLIAHGKRHVCPPVMHLHALPGMLRHFHADLRLDLYQRAFLIFQQHTADRILPDAVLGGLAETFN